MAELSALMRELSVIIVKKKSSEQEGSIDLSQHHKVVQHFKVLVNQQKEATD